LCASMCATMLLISSSRAPGAMTITTRASLSAAGQRLR
jgi:hypothetical protein